jgi:opacity protein-like surface antigen
LNNVADRGVHLIVVLPDPKGHGKIISQAGVNSACEKKDRKLNIMKKYQSILAVGVCAGAFCAGVAHAANGVYVGADAGGLLTLDTRVKEFVGSTPGTKMQLDPGVRIGFHGGYKLTDWFAVEGETGIMANSIKSITGADIAGDASFSNVPFLVNARFTIPHGKCPVTPYFGGGAGGSASVLNFDRHVDFNGTRVHGTDSDVVFAYQAFGGLRYAINERMGVGVEYHYFATTGASYDVGGTGGGKIAMTGVQSHAITAAFDFTF